MKRIWMLLLAALMVVTMAACGEDEPVTIIPTEPDEPEETTADLGKLVVLFTGGLEGVYARDERQGAVGYAGLAAYADVLEDDDAQIVLIDGGCSADPQAPDGFWEIVDACGYDIWVPGATELSAGVDCLKTRAEEWKNCTFLSCNLIDRSGSTTVFEPYTLVEVGSVQVGFVGVTAPGALTAADKQKYDILGSGDGQTLSDVVQQAIDSAANAGAAYVVVVGNLGTAPENTPMTTVEVISGITGMAAWLDCGSGAVLDGDIVADKDDFEIPVCAPGEAFRYVGQVVLDLNDGSAAVDLLTEFEKEDRAVKLLIDELDEG